MTSTKQSKSEKTFFLACHPPPLAGSQTGGLRVIPELGRKAHFWPHVSNLCFIGPPGSSGHVQVWELRVPRMVAERSQDLGRLHHGAERESERSAARAQRTGGFSSRLSVWRGKKKWASGEKRNTPRDTCQAMEKHFNDNRHHRYK